MLLVQSMRTFHWLVGALEVAVVLSSVSTAADPKPADTERRADEKTRQTNREQPQRITANKPVAPDAQAINLDGKVAACLKIANNEEVAMAKMALEHAKHDRVRDFAEKMVKDHSEMLAKLDEFGGRAATNRAGAQPGQPAVVDRNADQPPRLARDPANNRADQPAQPTATKAPGGFDFLAIKQQISEQCLASAQKCWEEKDLAKAEIGFVGSQIVAHQHMIDASKVLRNYVSSDLQSVVDDGIEKAESHQKHAEQLMDELAREACASAKKSNE